MNGRQVLRETLMDAYRGVPPVHTCFYCGGLFKRMGGGKPAEFPLMEPYFSHQVVTFSFFF